MFTVQPRTARAVYLWHLAGRDATHRDEAIACAARWIAETFIAEGEAADFHAVLAAADPAQRAYADRLVAPQPNGWTGHDGSADDVARRTAYFVVHAAARDAVNAVVLDSILAADT